MPQNIFHNFCGRNIPYRDRFGQFCVTKFPRSIRVDLITAVSRNIKSAEELGGALHIS